MAKPRKKRDSAPSTVSVRYELADLPSSQHRAGLAGLVLSVRYLENTGASGVCRIENLTSGGATFTADRAGMSALFDLVYAAASEEQPFAAAWKGKEPLRVVEVREVNPKTGKEKIKRQHYYAVIIPRLEVARDLDPTSSGADHEGLWTRLLRDMVWSILRGVPATREPFEARAAGQVAEDAHKALAQLGNGEGSVELPSTYYLGAQAKSAEDVPFRDRAHAQFLLHFWPLAASVYAPEIERRDRIDRPGFAIAIPDVADLELFTAELPAAFRERGTAAAAFRPRDAIVSIPEEAGLATLALLWNRVSKTEARRRTADLVNAVDVVLAGKEGNSIKLLSIARIDPSDSMADEYATLRRELWDPVFRGQTISNLLRGRRWWTGFDRLLSTIQVDRIILRRGDETLRRRALAFAHDARIKLACDTKESDMTDSEKEPRSVEDLILQVVRVFLARRLKAKGFQWDTVKGHPDREREYAETRSDLARSAFLAVRSRTSGSDFREYFVATLCSTGQPLSDEAFQTLSRALREQPDDVRTLTMLALSAKA